MGCIGRVLVAALLGFGVVTGAPAGAAAQVTQPGDASAPSDERTRGGFSLGLGRGGEGGSLVGTLWGGSDRWAILFRGFHAAEVAIFGESPAHSNSDFAILYGRRSEGRTEWVSVAAGPAIARSVRRGRQTGYGECLLCSGQYEKVVRTLPALAVQADAVWAPAEHFGLGLTALLSASAEHRVVGVVLNLHLGKQRAQGGAAAPPPAT